MLFSATARHKPDIRSASRYAAGLICIAAVLLPCFAALLVVFPVADDAWLSLLIKERGASALTSEVAHRPLFAWILRQSFQSRQVYFVVGFIVNAVTWIAMGLETQWLMGRLLPEWVR